MRPAGFRPIGGALPGGIPLNATTARGFADPHPSGSAGVVGRRRGLPGSRSAVGGLLVTVAMLGTWFMVTGRNDTALQPHVVARVDLPAGRRLDLGDLDIVHLDLPAAQRARTFSDVEQLVDVVTRGPIAEGELIQSGALGSAADGAGVQFSFTIEQEWAVGGAIAVGDQIDLYALGSDDRSIRVLEDVTVHSISGSDGGGLGSTGRQTITVSQPEPGQEGEIISAIRTGTLTVVRVTDRLKSDIPTAADRVGVDRGAGG